MLTLPSSIQQLVGRKLKRISTSHGRDRIIFDTWESRTNERTRYPYSITGTFDRILNLSQAVGYPITSISSLDEEESTGQQKMVIYTDKGFGVIFFSNLEFSYESFITEDGDDIVQEDDEDCGCLLTEESPDGGLSIGDVTLADVPITWAPPYKVDIDGRYYIVHEFDINNPPGVSGEDCPCEGEE